MSIRQIAPVGWDITGTCPRCSRMTRIWADGEAWWCSSCFNDVNGFDPRYAEWGEAK